MIATRVLSVITALFGLVVLYFAIRPLIDDGAVFPVAYLIESTVLCLTALQALTALCWLVSCAAAKSAEKKPRTLRWPSYMNC